MSLRPGCNRQCWLLPGGPVGDQQTPSGDLHRAQASCGSSRLISEEVNPNLVDVSKETQWDNAKISYVPD